MPRLTKLTALLLAALWLPATLHCRLEGLGMGGLFACAEPVASANHAADDGQCRDDGCQTVEAGQIIIAKSRIDVSLPPVFACACQFCLFPAAGPAPGPVFVAVRQDEALPLQRTWQFARRAALPARAPDSLNA